MSKIVPFKIAISESELEDLRLRLSLTRWPEKETVDDWSQGVPLSYIKEICNYWTNSYDWRHCESLLNGFGHYKTRIEGLDFHFIHVRSRHEDAIPLVITHGWPGSVIEFHKVIGPLTDPTAFGGNPADAFHLVAPSLPGYGFSDKPTGAGWNVERTAEAWSQLMDRLGYNSYVAQGGDWGALVTCALGMQDPKHCKALHLNMPIVQPDPETMDALTEEEKQAVGRMRYFADWDSGYAKEQSTRPQTIGYSLVDSPAGQAAWILEKFWSWTDCDDHPENVLSRDELLDNVTLYWLTASGASSARMYWESLYHPNYDPIDIPVGCSRFPKEIVYPSRRWAEKRFKNIIHWGEAAKGGHFAAMEVPEIFVEEVRTCFRNIR